jgi:hypothetical protein
MKLKNVSAWMLIVSMLLCVSSVSAGREPPVAKLVHVTGSVEYSRNGKTWRPVRRTKYLFSGYQIRTGGDGGGKLISQSTGMGQNLGPNSEISISASDVSVIRGSLSKPKKESSSIFQALSNKFAKAQRYTTVRRVPNSVNEEPLCDSKVRTISKVSISPSFPDLVWRNACPEYSYRLVIDDTVHEIAAHSNAEMIRFQVEGASTGEHSYRVEVLDIDGTVYIPRKNSAFVWISAKDEKKILAGVEDFGDDVFLATDLYESQNMFVAAMDAYREYFSANPDDNDMRPLLVKSYQDLKLSKLKENEARLYRASLDEEF